MSDDTAPGQGPKHDKAHEDLHGPGSSPHSGLDAKRACLEHTLKDLGKCVIAFSGGVDSSLLLAAAVRQLDERARAIVMHPPYVPARELEEARELADELGVQYEIIDMDMPGELGDNPERRCYLCKLKLFRKIGERARAAGIQAVLDGSNADDGQAYRPGMQALAEMGVRSPLAECGFTKADVRELSRSWGLPTWDKPAYSCLLTRLPHGSPVDIGLLERVETAERVLTEEGFPAVRVRTYRTGTGDLARIEVPPEQRKRFFSTGMMDRIDARLRETGYRYVTLDLAGYRSGSMDPQQKNHRSENDTTGGQQA